MSEAWQSKLDLVPYMYKQVSFSRETFGPGDRLNGILDHIAKELDEVREDPNDVYEWIDIVILALDGAWRAGYKPEQIAAALLEKQKRNNQRIWPDWREADPDAAIEHIPVENTPVDV